MDNDVLVNDALIVREARIRTGAKQREGQIYDELRIREKRNNSNHLLLHVTVPGDMTAGVSRCDSRDTE